MPAVLILRSAYTGRTAEICEVNLTVRQHCKKTPPEGGACGWGTEMEPYSRHESATANGYIFSVAFFKRTASSCGLRREKSTFGALIVAMISGLLLPGPSALSSYTVVAEFP